ncbi:BPSL0761 family protein [Lysobacter sp. A286]
MTTSTELTRNLIQAGSFLKELREDTTLPEHIRKEADRLVRHYPALHLVDLPDGEEAFAIEEPWFGAQLPPDWQQNYPFKWIVQSD